MVSCELPPSKKQWVCRRENAYDWTRLMQLQHLNCGMIHFRRRFVDWCCFRLDSSKVKPNPLVWFQPQSGNNIPAVQSSVAMKRPRSDAAVFPLAKPLAGRFVLYGNICVDCTMQVPSFPHLGSRAGGRCHGQSWMVWVDCYHSQRRSLSFLGLSCKGFRTWLWLDSSARCETVLVSRLGKMMQSCVYIKIVRGSATSSTPCILSNYSMFLGRISKSLQKRISFFLAVYSIRKTLG